MNVSSVLKFTGGLALAVVSGAIEGDKQDKSQQQTHRNNSYQNSFNDQHKAYGETYHKRFK